MSIGSLNAAAVSGNSGPVVVADGVTVQGSGAAVTTGSYVPGTSIDGTVQANGDGSANVDGFGTVNVRGAVQAGGHADASGAQVQAAMNGETSGPYGFNARGAAAGNASVDAKAGTAGVAGAANGEIGAAGYQARGAIDGKASGDLSGKFATAGAVNGCLKRPDGRSECYTESGKYLGTINADGSTKDFPTTATQSTSGASSVVMASGSVFAILAMLL